MNDKKVIRNTPERRAKTVAMLLERARAKHGDKYDYSKLGFEATRIPVTIICPIHGEFKQRIYSHIDSTGCGECGKEQANKSKIKTNEYFITKARAKHGDKYDYSKVKYVNTNSNVTIGCKKHGDFEQQAGPHMYGSNCPKCNIESMRMTKDEFVSRANIIHENKYTYDKVVMGTGVMDKVIITCPKHGDFTQQPNAHINASAGCPDCWEARRGEGKRFTKDEFITAARKKHGDKYDYSKVELGKSLVKSYVVITCPEHGDYIQMAAAHIHNGAGCRICNATAGEKKIFDFLIKNDLKHNKEHTYKGHKYRYDFYVYKLNILIEYDGRQHYLANSWGGIEGLVKQVANDRAKDELAKDKGVPLIRIPYTKYDELEDFLLHKISLIYKYRVKDNWYKDFLELCRAEKLSPGTKPEDVKQFLTKQ